MIIKKYIFVVLALAILGLPSYALKVKNPIYWNTVQRAEISSVEDALEIKIRLGKMWTPVYISNLNCHEYSRVYTLKSSGGNIYVRPRKRTVRISREPTEYLNKIFREHEGNIFFKPNGYGLFGNLVGEFFIGNDSLSQHMIEKGYCDFVQ